MADFLLGGRTMTEQPEPAFPHCEPRSDVAIQASGTSLRGAECRGNLFLFREFFANFTPAWNKGDAMRFKEAAEKWFEKKFTLSQRNTPYSALEFKISHSKAWREIG